MSGTALGFVIYLLCKKGGKISNSITRVCQRLIDGLPVVVFLMILYYIVFGNIQINNILVFIIAFSLIFASAIFIMVKNAISGIDYAHFEEVTVVNLLPQLNPEQEIEVKLSYSKMHEQTTIQITCSGINENAIEHADECSKRLIEHYCKKITFNPPEDEIQPAQFIIEV